MIVLEETGVRAAIVESLIVWVVLLFVPSLGSAAPLLDDEYSPADQWRIPSTG